MSPDWNSRFLYLMLEARDLDGFLEAAGHYLTADESRGLKSALEHFQTGFEHFWKRGGFLRSFDLRFRRFLEAGSLTGYLGTVARFFDVDPAAHPPPIISFVLLPEDGSTHAQALGRRLLIEIRPSDTPEAQIAVAAHEGSHFLFELIPAARRSALRVRAHAAGPDGAAVWRLLHEALPAALGQGLAVSQLTPEVFDVRGSWYHVQTVDRLAKTIFPIVRKEMASGRTIDGPFLDEAIREYQRTPGAVPRFVGDAPSPPRAPVAPRP